MKKIYLFNQTFWKRVTRNSFHNTSTTICRPYYNGVREELSDIKPLLQKYKGGSVDLEKKDNGICHVILNHPERRNALSGSMMVDLLDIVEELENWDAGVGLILRGAENKSNIFCSGGDLKTVHEISGCENGFRMSIFMSEVTNRLAALPLVSVCLLQGPALGGGAELTTLTDFRVCSPGASVSFVQARMGVAPGWGGARRLVELLGRRKALHLLLTCSRLGCEEGREMGYFDAVLSDEEAPGQAEQWLQGKIGQIDSSVVRSLKKMTVNQDQEMESRIFAPLWGGPANVAALERNIKHR